MHTFLVSLLGVAGFIALLWFITYIGDLQKDRKELERRRKADIEREKRRYK